MQLELKDIKGGELEQEYSCSLAEFPDLMVIAEQGGPRFGESLFFQLRFQRSGQFVEVDASLEAVVELQCGRCLQDFKQPLAESFSLTFVPQPEDDESGEDDVELETNELGLIPYRDDILKLQEPLQEQLLMAVPISPICKTSCRGLCPSCGVNLNIEKCDCVRKPFNSKFNILADIDFKKT
ncbi:MAG: hypothetical protein DRH06_09510 [Deltaproteobacteria bacterium]|nr:MAG: hypothetical protein DRH06_09510 [Deltaproteobacteria bacterium]